ncbi:hypothetical protein LP420_39910 [Massilia sp. B-10]|nr:hypothetical protein LP420_39910 [Massilia sp. B-10]
MRAPSAPCVAAPNNDADQASLLVALLRAASVLRRAMCMAWSNSTPTRSPPTSAWPTAPWCLPH